MKNDGLSCPLCLTADDPGEMLGVVIEHAVPVPGARVGLCKRCVVLIVQSAAQSEFVDPAEIFGAPIAEPNREDEGDGASWSPVPRFDDSSLEPSVAEKKPDEPEGS